MKMVERIARAIYERSCEIWQPREPCSWADLPPLSRRKHESLALAALGEASHVDEYVVKAVWDYPDKARWIGLGDVFNTHKKICDAHAKEYAG
jgi:hypothetical protein